MQTFAQLLEKLKNIEKMGFVKTHRSGNTGIGKTLEDLLGIEENNFAGPDGLTTELKAGRNNATSMLTLFTKSPEPLGINSILLKELGYPDPKRNGKIVLHSTMNAVSFNQLRGGNKLKIELTEDKIIINSPKLRDKSLKIPFWNYQTLQNSFELKIGKELLYVKADSRGSGINEEFHFNEAWLMRDFQFENFLKQLEKGNLLVDIRMGLYENGGVHDHGTAFRLKPENLPMCFNSLEQVL